MGVQAITVQLGSGKGLDVIIDDETATVEDLARAYAAASDDLTLCKEERHFPAIDPYGSCFGCTYCCHRFNIFLSRLDIARLALAEGVTPEEFSAFCTAYEPWKIDRVRLIEPLRYCLRDDDRGCGKYDDRPLICRLFICCPHTERAGRLIASVNRLAEEELVNWRAGQPDASNPFTGVFSYSQVLLRDCVVPELWQQLFQPGHEFQPVA